MRPIIGIILDWQAHGSFSVYPHYALRQHYFNAIYQAGGLPMAIPHIGKRVNEFLQPLDALVVPGGEFQSPATWYVDSGQANLNGSLPYVASPRTDYDKKIIEVALAQDMPILGICAGMQFLAGIHGCKMTASIPAYYPKAFNHWDAKPVAQHAHTIQIQANTQLRKIIKQDNIQVNSHHQEAIVEVDKQVVINAVAPDGVIEGIELPAYRFALGVQWHPEFFLRKADPNMLLFEALVDAI